MRRAIGAIFPPDNSDSPIVGEEPALGQREISIDVTHLFTKKYGEDLAQFKTGP